MSIENDFNEATIEQVFNLLAHMSWRVHSPHAGIERASIHLERERTISIHFAWTDNYHQIVAFPIDATTETIEAYLIKDRNAYDQTKDIPPPPEANRSN